MMRPKPSPLSGDVMFIFLGGPYHGTRRQMQCSSERPPRIVVHFSHCPPESYEVGEGAARGKMLWRGDPVCRSCGQLWTEH